MKAIRIGNDIRIEWPLCLSGDVAKIKDLGLSVEVRPSEAVIDWHNYAERPTLRKETRTVMDNEGLRCAARQHDSGLYGHRPAQPPFMGDSRPHPHAPTLLPYHIEDNKLVAVWPADRQFDTGEYDIIVHARKNKGGQAVADQCRFLRLVPHTAMADLPDGSGIEPVVTLQPLTIKLSGLSAYEVAVVNGFTGTQEEWLASLHKEADEAAEKANDAASKADTAAEAADEAAEKANKAMADLAETVQEISQKADNAADMSQEAKEKADSAVDTANEASDTASKALDMITLISDGNTALVQPISNNTIDAICDGTYNPYAVVYDDADGNTQSVYYEDGGLQQVLYDE